MLDKKKFYINGEWVNPINQNNFNVIDPILDILPYMVKSNILAIEKVYLNK